MQYDFIIVGAGSAGCVLARRLSDQPGVNVLLIEAGKPVPWWDFRVHMPAALAYPLQGKTYNWWFESEPEPHMYGRRIYHPRGKALGGSSAINGMIYIRGNPMDYQRWAEDPALSSWDYAHVLPYFKKAETRQKGGDDYRGDSGPLHVSTGPCQNPLFKAFFNAGQQAGHPYTDDVNGYQQEGIGPFDMTTHQGERWTVFKAYLRDVMDRPNLTVVNRCHVHKVMMEGKRAIGIDTDKGQFKGNEVIVSAGAFGSPQLLELSGIGQAAHLESVGVKPIHELNGVGENLQDHLEVYVQQAASKPVSMYYALKPWHQARIGVQWYLTKTGEGASNQFEAGGFIRSNEDVEYPNLQWHFLPIAIRYDGTAPKDGHGYQVHVGPMYSDSRGTVHIKSADSRAAPAIQFNYLSTEKDRKEWVEAIRKSRELFAQPGFDEFRGRELQPGPDVQTDEEILDFVRKDGESAYHPSCTCKMGSDEAAVVDASMRVHGLEGLRVVDASIMPHITNGNLNAPTIMLAEKAADIILGNTPLAPADVPWYRHNPSANA
ncbi:MAG: choline dehydrogenase [Gammaproteobacteria bacterium]|nr:choline dehydrogenase [Gammaproteobacteria bacterium]